jgi:hypothetical protein
MAVTGIGEPATWIEANQRALAAELLRLRRRIVGDAVADDPENGGVAGLEMSSPTAIDAIVHAFDLSPFEREVLLLCAGLEMDAQFAAAWAKANGGRSATFATALGTLSEPHWSALTPGRPLRRWRLIEVEPNQALTAAALRIDERILHFLAGINLLDQRLRPLLTAHDPSRLIAEQQQTLANSIAAAWTRRSTPRTVIHLTGNDFAGAEDIAAAAAAATGLQLHVMRAEDVPAGAADLESFVTLWEREAVLLPAALLVRCGDAAITANVREMAERIRGPLVIAAREPARLRGAMLSFELTKPDTAEQKRLWQLALGANGRLLNGALDGVTAQFHLSAQAIAVAGATVNQRIEAGEPAATAVWSACREGGRRGLDELAQRIPPGATWDDLVLPAGQLAALRQIAAQVRQRTRVYDEWGFGDRNARGLGVAVLFSGGSGTGKTLAAEVLAGDLALDLYRIDLSSVVSKYIGETEKNLRRVFDAAEESGAILLFDEADALFGKRSEVKDSHDRYANIEVSYLLQRMEAYRGLAILTTNLKSALDTSFQRRLRFIVNFPFPDTAQREAIWQRSVPPAAPTDALDFYKLARLNVTCGSIRNISLNAAFLAADEGAPLSMRHLRAAAHAESAKLERPLAETETRGWT